MVFNVENSTLSSNKVLDVLKHTLGVLVHEDKLSVKQATPYCLYSLPKGLPIGKQNATTIRRHIGKQYKIY